MWRLIGRSTSCAASQIGFPVRVPDEGHVEVLGRAGEEDRLVAHVAAAMDLRDRLFDVPEGRRHHRDEALRVGLDPLDEPVVVGAHAGHHQVAIAEPEEGLAAEAADVRVEGHRPGADLVHVLEARLRVVGRRRALVDVLRDRREGLVPARHRGGRPPGSRARPCRSATRRRPRRCAPSGAPRPGTSRAGARSRRPRAR